MMQQVHRRHATDTITVLPVTLKQLNNSGVSTVVDLTGKTVKFKMYDSANGYEIVALTTTGITVVSASGGTVNYDFSSSGVSAAGKYYGFFVVTDSTETDHFPLTRDELIILIDSDAETAEEAHARKSAAYHLDVRTLTDFPDVLVTGDSYQDSNDGTIALYIRDSNGEVITSVGDRDFEDATATFQINRVGETATDRVITGTATWTPAVGTAAPAHFAIELPSSETSKGLARYKYIGTLRCTWGGPGTDVMSYRTEEITFTI